MQPIDIVELMKETFQFIADFEGDVPGMSPKDCGNCTLQDVPNAKKEAAIFVTEVLSVMQPENMTYPTEQ